MYACMSWRCEYSQTTVGYGDGCPTIDRVGHLSCQVRSGEVRSGTAPVPYIEPGPLAAFLAGSATEHALSWSSWPCMHMHRAACGGGGGGLATTRSTVACRAAPPSQAAQPPLCAHSRAALTAEPKHPACAPPCQPASNAPDHRSNAGVPCSRTNPVSLTHSRLGLQTFACG